MFETGVVQVNECYSKRQVRRHNWDIFSIFFNMKVYCLFSLESHQRGDSYEYTQYTISQNEKENHSKLSQICSKWICCKGPKNEFETGVEHARSVFEHLKFVYFDLYVLLSIQ